MEYLSPAWVGLYAWIATALFILLVLRRLWWALAVVGIRWLRSRREPRRAGSHRRRRSEVDAAWWQGWNAATEQWEWRYRNSTPTPPSSAQTGKQPPSAGSEQATAPTEDGQSGRSTSFPLSYHVKANGNLTHQGIIWDWPNLIETLGELLPARPDLPAIEILIIREPTSPGGATPSHIQETSQAGEAKTAKGDAGG